MASSLISPATVNYHRNSSILTASSHQILSIHFFSPCNCSTSKIISSHRLSLPVKSHRNCDSRRFRCSATSPHPPESGPPPGDDEQDSNSGIIVSISEFCLFYYFRAHNYLTDFFFFFANLICYLIILDCVRALFRL